MATRNVTLTKADGWVEVSTAANVCAEIPGTTGADYVWSDTDPAADFIPKRCPAGAQIVRDFETGALRMRATTDINVNVCIDEV